LYNGPIPIITRAVVPHGRLGLLRAADFLPGVVEVVVTAVRHRLTDVELRDGLTLKPKKRLNSAKRERKLRAAHLERAEIVLVKVVTWNPSVAAHSAHVATANRQSACETLVPRWLGACAGWGAPG
jgi:hypothetical protein